MKPKLYIQDNLAITYDADCVESPGAELFDPGHWRSSQALVGEAAGRGSAWFIDAPFGAVVLRQYLRGGWVAKLSRQSYFFTTLSRSRPFREFHILAALHTLGLPVPRLVAALCEHHGVISTGSIITMRIPSAKTLFDVLPVGSDSAGLKDGFWNSVGQCLRRFHNAGVWHADLNLRNILVDGNQDVFLIDFDRARYTPQKVVDGKGNLARLKRSFLKLWPNQDVDGFQAIWNQLLAGYNE